MKLLSKVINPVMQTSRLISYNKSFMHFLKNSPSTNLTVLNNGFKVATQERSESVTACVGLFIDGGSRYETEEQNGLTHFLEHLVFKGTADNLAPLGTKFKCHASREMVSLTCQCFAKDIVEVIDVLANSVYKKSFSSEEFEKQRKIILLEMLDNESNNKNVVMDYLHATAFQGTPLGQPVLGRSENVRSFKEADITKYVNDVWLANRAILVVVGGIVDQTVVDQAKNYFGSVKTCDYIENQYCRYTGSEIRYRNDDCRAGHVAIAVEGPPHTDTEANLTMRLAKFALGSWARAHGLSNDNSCLIARAANYLADGYYTFYKAYKDTGLFGVLYLSEPLNQDDMMYNIQKEFMKLCTVITEEELVRSKNELKTQILYETESESGACFNIAHYMLYNGKMPTLEQQMEMLDNLKVEEVKKLCKQYLYDRCPAVAAVGPIEGVLEYTRIRAGMYSMRI